MHKKKNLWNKHSDYTVLKYLQSSGTQYIDTRVYGNLNTKVEITYCFPNDSTEAGSGRVFGSREDSVSNAFGIGTYSGTIENGTQITLYFSNSNTGQTTVTTLTTGKWYVSTISNGLCSTSGVKETLNTTGGSDVFTTPETLKLFGFDSAGIMGYGFVQISSCRIWQDNVLVRDFVAALDKDGVPCMWDKVNNDLYYNKGTGTFTYEELNITPIDCVYAGGNSYVNTYCFGNSETKMEMVMTTSIQSSSNRGSMGSRISANSQFFAIGYGTSQIASDFNNSSYSPYRASIIYDLNKKYRIYTSKEKRSIIDENTGTVLAENNTLCEDSMDTNVLLLGAETNVSARHIGKIYSAKILDGNNIIRDFIPIIDKNNVAGFYDKCLNMIFYSLGSEEFIGHIEDSANDYEIVHYIQSDGNQYINTNYVPNNNTKIECDFQPLQWEGDSFMIGQWGNSSTFGRTCIYIQPESKTTPKYYQYGFGTGTGVENTNFKNFSLDNPLDRHYVIMDKNSCIVDGVTVVSNLSGSMETNTETFWIGKANDLNSRQTNPTQIYGCKIWDDGLVNHFIPAVQGTTAGMIDIVHKTFYTNQGTGSFITG